MPDLLVPVLALMGVAGVLALAFAYARRREAAQIGGLVERLGQRGPATPAGPVRSDPLSELPDPVARYFRNVLRPDRPLIVEAELEQSGVLRSGPSSRKWLGFTAREQIRPPAPGFLWDARIAWPAAMHLRVVDGYVAGHGAGRASLLSAIPLAAEAGGPEFDAGALHRYLAEAVWFPTALLPQCGPVWEPVDERTAVASLSDRGTTVSLEFRFNARGEIVGVYSPGRFQRAGDGYRQVPWEGRFLDYRKTAGMRMPRYGEVGWHEDDRLELVWKGQIRDAKYRFG